MPTFLGDMGFIMAFKVFVCTARQGTGRQLQSICKSRGNPEAEDFFVLLKSCNLMPKLPQHHRALPHSFLDAATLLCLSLLFSPRTPLLSHTELVPLSALLSLCQLPFTTPVLIPPLCFSAALRNSSKPEFKRKPREESLPRATCFQA